MSEQMIAGTVTLRSLMSNLSRTRPVFHSEADFQFAFAQALASQASGVRIRLEVRQPSHRAEYVDLACWTTGQRTLIEFKYATAGWTGTDPSGEMFQVRNHAAFDLARRHLLHDVSRLERFVDGRPDTNGLAVMLTNEKSLWCDGGRPNSRDRNFRLHEGRELTGHLEWGTGGTPQYDHALRGLYLANWHDYSSLDQPKAAFRWLSLEIKGGAAV